MRLITGMLLKRGVLVLAVVFFHLRGIYAQGNDREVFYNYYRRNLDGSFVLEQIDASAAGVELFRYKAVYDSRNRMSTVTGYYYQSDDVKFIDTVMGNRIVKTEYFNRFNPSVYTRTNSYGADGVMSSIAITHEYNGDSGNEINRIWIFFENDPLSINYDYYAIRVQESDYGVDGRSIIDLPGASRIMLGYAVSKYMVSEGRVSREYQPLFVKSKLITRTKKLLIPISSFIFEWYSYDDKGNTANYMLIAKNSGMIKGIETTVVDGAVVKRTRTHSSMFGMAVGTGLEDDFIEIRIQKDGYELSAVGPIDDEKFKSLENAEKINIKDLAEKLYAPVKKIVHIKDDLYIEYQISRSADWEETGEFTLFCNDERVEFKPGETPKSTLTFDFDVYPDNGLFTNQYVDSLVSPAKRFERAGR
jgi:hypothetical protein